MLKAVQSVLETTSALAVLDTSAITPREAGGLCRRLRSKYPFEQVSPKMFALCHKRLQELELFLNGWPVIIPKEVCLEVESFSSALNFNFAFLSRRYGSIDTAGLGEFVAHLDRFVYAIRKRDPRERGYSNGQIQPILQERCGRYRQILCKSQSLLAAIKKQKLRSQTDAHVFSLAYYALEDGRSTAIISGDYDFLMLSTRFEKSVRTHSLNCSPEVTQVTYPRKNALLLCNPNR